MYSYNHMCFWKHTRKTTSLSLTTKHSNFVNLFLSFICVFLFYFFILFFEVECFPLVENTSLFFFLLKNNNKNGITLWKIQSKPERLFARLSRGGIVLTGWCLLLDLIGRLIRGKHQPVRQNVLWPNLQTEIHGKFRFPSFIYCMQPGIKLQA